MTNRYLEKIARRLHVKDEHLNKAKELVQGELIGRGVDAAKKQYHKHKKKHGHEKVAIALTLWECPKTGKRKWVAGDKAGPEGYVIVKKSYRNFNRVQSS